MQQAMMLDTWFQQFVAAFPKAAEAPPALSSEASQASVSNVANVACHASGSSGVGNAVHGSEPSALDAFLSKSGGLSHKLSADRPSCVDSIDPTVESVHTMITSVGSKRTVREQDEMDFFGVGDTDKRTKYEMTEPTGKLSDKVVQRIQWMRVQRLESELARQEKLAKTLELRAQEAKQAADLCRKLIEERSKEAGDEEPPVKSKLDISKWPTLRIERKIVEFQTKLSSLELLEERDEKAQRFVSFYRNRIDAMTSILADRESK